MPKKVSYNIGDVFKITLPKTKIIGYGRILRKEEQCIFIDLYDVTKINNSELVDDLKRANTILSIWAVDNGVVTGEWEIIGSIPIKGKVVMPDFWGQDALTDQYYLVRNDKRIYVKEDEIGNAQPYGIFGKEAVEIRYEHDLKNLLQKGERK